MEGWKLEPFFKLNTMDIKSENDIDLLIDCFYKKIQSNNALSPHFAHVNWEKHLPKMKQFWCFILLDQTGYTTNVTEKHLGLPLTKELFSEWISLFNETVDANFEGPNAAKAKQRALLISISIQSKMKLL